MKNRWINLLFALLVILIGGLSFHLFVLAQTQEAVGLIINILKPLNILLISVLLFVLSRHLLKLYLGYRRGAAGFRLQTRLVLALLPLTLLPSLALFFLSTSFVDEFLQRTVKNPEHHEILEVTDSFTKQHFETIEALYEPHGPALLPMLRAGKVSAVRTYLKKYHLEAVRYLVDREERLQVGETELAKSVLQRLRNPSRLLGDRDEFVHFDDGRIAARYPHTVGNETVELLYFMDTGFTERYLFLRDSFVFLKYGQKKNDKLLGLNRSILLITTLSLIFGGIWIGMSFSKRFLVGFKVLIESAGRISRGDLDTRVNLSTGDEMEDVINAFNSMAGTLKQNQAELEARARDLGLLNARLQSEIHYNKAILEQTKAGILSTDSANLIRTFNPAFVAILEWLDLQPSQNWETLLAEGRHPALYQLWCDFKARGPVSRQLELQDSSGNTIHVAASLVPLDLEGLRFGSLLVLEDLSELLAAQKLAAWREVAKRIAHEIKNPLTPIQLSIQRVERKARNGAEDLAEAVHSAHETIMGETKLLKNLVDEFSAFAKMPTPVKVETDLAELVASVVDSYQLVHGQLQLEMEAEPGTWRLQVDPSQIRQVLSNLLNNAAQASSPGDRVTVGLAREGEGLLLYVDDEGSGIQDADREKIFLPYYSRSAKGTGLGLAIVKRIISDHNGSVEALRREPKGSRIAIHFF